jgi:DNA-binding Lrp family transcriptional regulator
MSAATIHVGDHPPRHGARGLLEAEGQEGPAGDRRRLSQLGRGDYSLRARVPDVAAYDRLYQRLIAGVDMVDVAASFVMEEIKDTTEVPLGYA